jgi:hypothetical protein
MVDLLKSSLMTLLKNFPQLKYFFYVKKSFGLTHSKAHASCLVIYIVAYASFLMSIQ